MRLLVLSDLHVEAAAYQPQPVDCDAVVLAGDIGNGVAAIRWAAQAFAGLPIIYVPGNHEFYGGAWQQTLAQMRDAACATGVHLLERDAKVLGSVRFLGCTLWTDFAVYERAGRGHQLSRQQAQQMSLPYMADYRAIAVLGHAQSDHPGATGAADTYRLLTPQDTADDHQRCRAWLAQQLAQPFDGATVVVTHHLPSWQSVSPLFAHAVTNAAFVSDCDDLVRQADVWIHGHTHVSRRYRLGDCLVVCNPRGYPRGPQVFENDEFDAGFVLDVTSRGEGARAGGAQLGEAGR